MDLILLRYAKGGASTINYLLGSLSLTKEIREFTIFGRPVGLAVDHAYLCVDATYGYKRIYMLRMRLCILNTSFPKKQLMCLGVDIQ